MPGFLSFSYWFSLYPPALQLRAQIVLGAIFIVLIAAGLLTLLVWRRTQTSKMRRHALSRVGHGLVWAGVSGIIWLLMTVSGVPVLGMRLWLIVGAIFFGWVLVGPIREWRTTIPLQEQGAAQKASYEKWLPKPKK